MPGASPTGVLDKFPTHARSPQVHAPALNERFVVLGLVEVANDIRQQPQNASCALELGDRAPALVEHGDQLRVEGIRLHDVITIAYLPTSRGHVLAQLLVHVPVGFRRRPSIGFDRLALLLTPGPVEEPSADNLVDLRTLDRLTNLLDTSQHLLQRLEGTFGILPEELGKLARERGDHASVRAIRDGNGQLLE